ncbi:hypothetical protein HCA58_22910 [Micromonospora sp. HNM0581]|nr:hypothetical protein [Micromonospora sp. HNM0581]NLU81139.1 hypothetical protein [Micromonospora sp. HNM0581]
MPDRRLWRQQEEELVSLAAQQAVAVFLAEVADVEPVRAARIGRWTAI